MVDLAVIVADKNMQSALKGIFGRHQSLGIRPITWQINISSGRDGGVRRSGPEVLTLRRREANHGIIMLDWEGSGVEDEKGALAVDLEAELDGRLRVDWEDQAKSIVIDPEVDAWVWGSDNAIRQSLSCDIANLRGWLEGRGFAFHLNRKPVRPKEAIEDLMNHLRLPRSSSYYQQITSTISLEKCVDPAFLRLKATLQRWFPAPN